MSAPAEAIHLSTLPPVAPKTIGDTGLPAAFLYLGLIVWIVRRVR